MNDSRMSPQDIPNFWLRQVGIKLWVTCSSYSLIQEQFRSIKPSSVTSAKVILRKILHWFRYLQGDNNNNNNNQHCIIINIDGWSYKSLRVVLNITLPTKTRYIHIFKHTISLGNESLGDESLGKKEKKQFWINSISFQISQIFIIYINTCYVFKNVQIKWDTVFTRKNLKYSAYQADELDENLLIMAEIRAKALSLLHRLWKYHCYLFGV